MPKGKNDWTGAEKTENSFLTVGNIYFGPDSQFMFTEFPSCSESCYSKPVKTKCYYKFI